MVDGVFKLSVNLFGSGKKGKEKGEEGINKLK
jgi:hypothetical protein